jgi:hypothetical protein
MSNPNDDLKKRLTEHIKKTGYPLEIEVLQALSEQKGWLSWSNQMYLDPDEKKPRDIDVGAFYFPWLSITPSQEGVMDYPEADPVPFTPTMLVECKTSNDCSLVLFPTKQFSFMMLEGQTLELPFIFGKKKFNLAGTFGAGTIGFLGTRFHYNTMEVSSTYTLTKPKGNSKPDIYEGVTTLVKAQSQASETNLATWKQSDAQQLSMLAPKNPPLYPISYAFLAIAFQGPMFEAKIIGGDPVLKELTHGCISSAYWSTRLERPVTYVIDVVKSTHFPEYLRLINNDLQTARNTLKLYEKEARAYLSR